MPGFILLAKKSDFLEKEIVKMQVIFRKADLERQAFEMN